MALTPLTIILNASPQVQQLINSQAIPFLNGGANWSNYINNTVSTNGDQGNLNIAANGGTAVVSLPPSTTSGKLFLWVLSGVCNVSLTGVGTMNNSDYGIVRSDFTGVTITNNGQNLVTGYFIIAAA